MNQNDEKKKMSLIIKIVLVMLLVCFFFPLCTVSCSNTSQEITALDSTFGIEVMGEKIDGNFMCGLLFLIPVVLLICSFALKKIHSLANLSIMGAMIDIIILIIYRIRIPKLAEEYLATVEFEFGYYLEILLNALLIVWAFVSKSRILEINEPETEEEVNRKGKIFISVYCISLAVIILIIVSRCI